MARIFIRQRQGEIWHRRTEEKSYEGRVGRELSMLALKTEPERHGWPPEARTGEEGFSPRASGQTHALLTPRFRPNASNLRFLTSRTVKEYRVYGGLNLSQQP